MTAPAFKDLVKELRRVPAGSLRPNPLNWRTHPKAQADALRGLLAEVGFASALLARELPDGSLELIDGHLRADVAADAVVPVLVVDVDAAGAAKLLATLDPLAAMAGSDRAKLDELLRDVQTGDEALAALITETAGAAGLDYGKPAGEAGGGGDGFDPTPEPDGPTRAQPGDLWVIGGGHRLLVGDCTDPANVARLMGGDRAACVFTDPPYGVSVGAKNRLLNSVQKAGCCLADITDDDASPEDLKARLVPAFVNYRTLVMADDCTLMVCSPQIAELAMMMMMMMKEAGLPPRHIIIWKKNQPTFSMGRLDYDYQHEPILLTWRKRHKKVMAGPHKTSVWDVAKPRASADHPTMKPVELYTTAYLNHSEPGDVVADLYGGSGAAVVAAHQTRRLARVCEIDPKYADVILKRAEADGLACEKVA